MSNLKVYPVIFTQIDDSILGEVPDLEIVSEGMNLAGIIEITRNLIGLKGIALEKEGRQLPKPSDELDIFNSMYIDKGKQRLSYVDIDLEAFKRAFSRKMIRRNVTIPSWLNEKADEANLNVSRVLRDALMKKLDISDSEF